MSVIQAGNTTTTSLIYTGDTTGNLVFTTGGANTVALTLANTQAATFANNVTIGGTTTHAGNASFTNLSATSICTIGPSVTPSAQLTIKADTGQGAPLNLLSTDSGANPQIIFTGNRTYQIGTGNSGSGFTNMLYFYDGTAGAERMRLTNDGNFFIGASSINARLGVQGASANNAAQTIYLQNSSGTQLMYVRNDGYFTTGQAAFSPYNYTTGLGANLYIDVNGGLVRSTSSIRYKSDVKDAYYGLQDLLKLRPVTYKSKNDGKTVHGGLIAEEVDAVGLKEFVQYNADNEPDALSYGNMVSLCIKAIQELNAKVEAQAAEIKTLKGN